MNPVLVGKWFRVQEVTVQHPVVVIIILTLLSLTNSQTHQSSNRERHHHQETYNGHSSLHHMGDESSFDIENRGSATKDIDLSTECQHGLCENVPDYPVQQIKRMLSTSKFAQSYFAASDEMVRVDNRFNTDTEMYLCKTMTRTVFPEKAKNTKKIEKVIVNVEGHQQGVVYETCTTKGACEFSSTFPIGYTSYCQQKYMHKKLMVLGSDENFVFDTFEVPSCCVCTLKRTE